MLLVALAGCRPSPSLQLGLPLDCEPGRTCFVQNYVDHDPGPEAVDHACRRRTYDGHDGTDLRVPDLPAMEAGVDVLAPARGAVLRARDGEPERLLGDGEHAPADRECGNGLVLDHGDGWQTQLCHLARGSLAVAAGDLVERGARLGRVGLSGETQFPHVHLTVRLRGRELDPFAVDALPGACGGSPTLWAPEVAAALAGPPSAVLNVGFAAGEVTSDDVERGRVPPPTAGGGAIVAFARAMSLEAGDALTLALLDPDGRVAASNTEPSLPRAKAVYLLVSGVRSRGGGPRPGTWRLRYEVTRGGVVVLEREAALTL